ncbi:DMT family transporter [Sphingomonas sp. IC4-52]|uniref:DMT family transporter n=1 Tax=Sphingomonas sp. IC4-52 TaxID=2887202 RepID=UPI002AB327E7|nr:DMT family transporter [Sphingomonas sp. IC4-52]
MNLALAWIPATMLAGLLQAWRTAVQQRLRAQLSINGAGIVRYVYGLPVVLLVLGAYLWTTGATLPSADATFLALAAVAAIAQLLATNLLIMAFGYRNFVVGTAFSKTETVQAALFGWLILGERITALVGLAVTLGMAGVLTLALGGRNLSGRDVLRALGQPAALCGLASGGLFAITAVFIRRAALHLDPGAPLLAALVTLVTVILIQALSLGMWVAVREPATLLGVARTWRTSAQVGVLAGMGSICLFCGLAIAPVALVRIVAQVEVVFTLAFAALYLREPFHRFEAAGLLMVVGGVVLALLGALR